MLAHEGAQEEVVRGRIDEEAEPAVQREEVAGALGRQGAHHLGLGAMIRTAGEEVVVRRRRRPVEREGHQRDGGKAEERRARGEVRRQAGASPPPPPRRRPSTTPTPAMPRMGTRKKPVSCTSQRTERSTPSGMRARSAISAPTPSAAAALRPSAAPRRSRPGPTARPSAPTAAIAAAASGAQSAGKPGRNGYGVA